MAISREIRFITAGDNTTVSETMYNNTYALNYSNTISYYQFDKPKYYTYGGSLDYYNQNIYTIFTNLAKPSIRFKFTANTENLSGDSYFIHEIYKLDYETYKLYSDNQISNSPNIINKESTDNGGRTIRNRDFINESKREMGSNISPVPDKFYGSDLTNKDLSTIQSYFSSPLLILTASTSAITGSIYDLSIDQYIKKLGNYKQELFTDKAQFFINTKLVFNVSLNKSYSDFYNLNGDGNLETSTWNNQYQIKDGGAEWHSINRGPFTGINVQGYFFTFFLVPDKPSIEYGSAQGVLTTFTPEFRWSNTNTADSFLIQINYFTGDTSFSGTVYNYPIDKTDNNRQVIKNRLKDSTTEVETEKEIYTAQIPVKSNKAFIYRIGNSKEIVDIFDVRRNVVTFSEIYSASTAPQKIQVYVGIESDSKNTEDIQGLVMAESLSYENSTYTLKGKVSGSTITGATLQLTYPNASYMSTITDLYGNYEFSDVPEDTYTLTTNYRGYNEDVRIINLSENTTLDFRIEKVWGNVYDTFEEIKDDLFY